MPKTPPSYSASDSEAGPLTFYIADGQLHVVKGFECVDTNGKSVSDQLDMTMAAVVADGGITSAERNALGAAGGTTVTTTVGLLRKLNSYLRVKAGLTP